MGVKPIRCPAMALTTLTLLTLPLAGQSLPVRQGMLSLEDGRIFYEMVGSGPPMVVVHGGPGLDHNYLRPGLDVLASGNTLVYYDQRGTGRSDTELTEEAVSLESFVDDVDALREALGYEEISVLGHSFGGLFAMAYALRHPDRTRALVLLNTTEPGTRFQDRARQRQAAARTGEDRAELAELRASEGFAARSPAVLSQMYRVAYRGSMKDPERITELDLEISDRTAENGPEVGRLLGASLGTVDWWEELSGLRVPTLVAQGRHDPMPLAMAEALTEVLPRGRLLVLDAGHFPFVEDPQGLVAGVAGFLAELR